MKPKKIAILYAGAKHWGGVETYLEQLFLNVDSSKLNLELISLGEWPLVEKIKGHGLSAKVFEFRWYKFWQVFGLAGYLKKNNFDLVTVQGLVANFYGRLASLFSGVPSLVTVHSDYRFDYPGPKKYLYNITFRLLSPFTKKYIAVSKFLKKETEELGVHAEKITVVYNGVKDVGEQLHPLGAVPIFGSLGRLHYKKGYAGLIEAASILPDQEFKIYIWGDGEEKENLQKQITRLGLDAKVKLKGFTKNIPGALSEIDYYIQPSLEEGFGITVAEGMYAGKPVIVTPAGALPELITDGETGVITKNVEPKSIAAAMKAVMSDRSASEIGKKAREYAVVNFGIEKWAHEIENAYLEAAK